MKVGNHPVLFSELYGRGRKGEEFAPSQSTTNQKSKDGIVAFAPRLSPWDFNSSDRP
jgi:hypothetical protein